MTSRCHLGRTEWKFSVVHAGVNMRPDILQQFPSNRTTSNPHPGLKLALDLDRVQFGKIAKLGTPPKSCLHLHACHHQTVAVVSQRYFVGSQNLEPPTFAPAIGTYKYHDQPAGQLSFTY